MAFFQRRRREQELEDEFRFHLEKHIEDGIARGLTPEDASAAAMRDLDRIALRKEQCRDERRFVFFETLMQDLRYAIRVLRKSPAFTTVAIISLALGIGANTAIFSVMDVLLLRPLPVPEPNRLQLVKIPVKHGVRYSFNDPLFEMVRDRNRVFSDTMAWTSEKFQTPVGGDMLLLPSVLASGAYFRTLAVAPQIGRVFGPEDDQAMGGVNGPVAVISDAYWSARYHRDPSVLGKMLVLNAIPVSIVGVMPPGFFGVELGTAPDVWVPLNLQRKLEDARCISSPGCWYLRVMGKLKPGISVEAAQAQLRSISPQIMADDDPPRQGDRRADFLAQTLTIEPGAGGYSGLKRLLRTPLQVLMSLVGMVLLIACANMANLLSARALARHREVAVRLAMGAARTRIIRQFLTESLLLAVAGALGGCAIAAWATRMLITMLSSIGNPIALDLTPDWRVLLFTTIATMATGFAFGFVSALRSTRTGLGAALKERVQIPGTSRVGSERLLLGFQVALSVVLLSAAGLLAGSLIRLLSQNLGFEPKGVTVVQIATSQLGRRGDAVIDMYERILRRVRALPGIESAAMLENTPLSDSGWDNFVDVPGGSSLPETQRDTYINSVSAGFLATMRIPLLAGRDFSDRDTASSARVGIISETAARRLFPRGDALGNHIIMAGSQDKEVVEIVGIAGDSKYLTMRTETPFTMFVCYKQWLAGANRIAVRTSAPLRQTYLRFRELLRQEAPGAPIVTIRTMEQQIDESLSTERLVAFLSVFFAALALSLTAIGLYGVLAYSVSRRTSEIGVRMALGAQRAAVVRMVLREALGHTLAGAVVGLVAVAASAKVIASLLYGVKPNDPWTMSLAVIALGLVCAIAAWMPARRASKLDPMVALREE